MAGGGDLSLRKMLIKVHIEFEIVDSSSDDIASPNHSDVVVLSSSSEDLGYSTDWNTSGYNDTHVPTSSEYPDYNPEIEIQSTSPNHTDIKVPPSSSEDFADSEGWITYCNSDKTEPTSNEDFDYNPSIDIHSLDDGIPSKRTRAQVARCPDDAIPPKHKRSQIRQETLLVESSNGDFEEFKMEPVEPIVVDVESSTEDPDEIDDDLQDDVVSKVGYNNIDKDTGDNFRTSNL